MEMDAIRITTLDNGKRLGQLIQKNYEDKVLSGANVDYKTSLVYKIFSKDVDLIQDQLPVDGDYDLKDFQYLPTPAAIVNPDTGIIPTNDGKLCYMYTANDDLI